MDILNIDGNVKSAESISYHYTEERGRYLYQKRIIFYDQENKTLYDTYYDEEGAIIQKMIITHNDREDITSIVSSYDEDDKLDMKHIFTYDEKGNTLEEIMDRYITYKDEYINTKHLYFYDEYGKKAAIESYENGILKGKTILKNDEKNTTEILYNKEGDIIRKTEKVFDENKKLITRNVQDRGKLIFVEQNSYDEKGNLSENLIDNRKTERKKREIKRYNDLDQVVEHSIYFKDNHTIEYIFSQSFFEYDEKGNVIKNQKISYEEDGSIDYTNTYIYKYDEQNNVVEECEYNKEGEIYCKITYEYDERGNEIKKIKQRGDELVVTEHTIEYY